jgi:hypothetical protein
MTATSILALVGIVFAVTLVGIHGQLRRIADALSAARKEVRDGN